MLTEFNFSLKEFYFPHRIGIFPEMQKARAFVLIGVLSNFAQAYPFGSGSAGIQPTLSTWFYLKTQPKTTGIGFFAFFFLWFYVAKRFFIPGVREYSAPVLVFALIMAVCSGFLTIGPVMLALGK